MMKAKPKRGKKKDTYRVVDNYGVKWGKTYKSKAAAERYAKRLNKDKDFRMDELAKGVWYPPLRRKIYGSRRKKKV